jgi:hypothetical protein
MRLGWPSAGPLPSPEEQLRRLQATVDLLQGQLHSVLAILQQQQQQQQQHPPLRLVPDASTA